MHLHLNPLGGVAGDMFCAALLDARPDLLAVAQEAVACLDMPTKVDIELQDSNGVIRGKHFSVTPQGSIHHQHTAFRDILWLLESAPLQPGVRERSAGIFTLLAKAEGRVHGVAPEDVSFHEVGSWDSIADIVSAAALLDALDVQSVSCAPLPLGRGRVRTAHGLLPVPAPATALLLEGLPVSDDAIEGERVTPTGAAIVKSLNPEPVTPAGGALRASGMGFGTRSLPGIPNCLQILCIEKPSAAVSAQVQTDRVAVLRFEVDDQTPEDFAVALDRIRETEGVLSVTSLQGIGKGGRPTMSVEVLARPANLNGAVDACFRETTTIGLRWQETDRYLLPRRQHTLQVEGRQVSVKAVDRPRGSTAKTEVRDISGISGQAERARIRHLAEARTLVGETDID